MHSLVRKYIKVSFLYLTRRTPTGNVLIVAGSALELLAILVFLYNIRTRIRPIGSHLREAAGEKF